MVTTTQDFDEDNSEMVDIAARELPWHPLGMIASGTFVRPAVLAEEAGLTGWNVRKVSLPQFLPKNFHWDMSAGDLVGVVRDSPTVDRQTDLLSIVTDKYNVTTNEDIIAVAEAFSQQSQASAETAGSLRGGRQIFIVTELPNDYVLDPDGAADVIKNYVTFIVSHDKTFSFVASNTPVRKASQTVLNVELPGTTQQYAIKHTKHSVIGESDALEVIRSNENYFNEFTRRIQQLYAVRVTDAQFYELILRFYPEPRDNKKGAETRWAFKVADIMSIWHRKELAPIKHTGWGALSAIAEYVQWSRQARGAVVGFYQAGAGLEKKVNDSRTVLYNKVWNYIVG